MGRKTPALLYKYYGAERVDVARSLLVRFSQPAALNDPFEFALNVPPDAVVDAVRKIGRQAANPISFVGMALSAAWESKENEKLRLLPSPLRWLIVALLLIITPVLALAILPFARRQLLKAMSAAGKGFENVLASKGFGSFLVFSCSELWNSVPMWAHYAGNHTGFVIGIDPACAFQLITRKGETRPVKARAVSYVESLPGIRLNKRGTDAIFGSKFKDWSYEREWRFTALSDDAAHRGSYAAGHEVLLFPLKPQAIREVVFGLNASQETIDAVREAFESAGCEPEYSKVAQGDGYEFTRSASLEVNEPPTPQPVPSLLEMFVDPAIDLYEQFQVDARAHPIMKRFIR